MREVNFSIPNVNKAAVNITTTLYDRRALDCTSTLPLINSLNHLAYLTVSSARIREILTVDGGVEQLVCILKQGRSRDMMETWKWSLAFQCLVNIGVRGSEDVRTRVVEADMVPVIATLLDNYIRVVEKLRVSGDGQQHPNPSRAPKPNSSSRDQQPSRPAAPDRTAAPVPDHRTVRRHPPPPSIEIPQPYPRDTQQGGGGNGDTEGAPTPQVVLTSPPERTAFPHDNSHRPQQDGPQPGPATQRRRIGQPLATALPTLENGLAPRPVRDADRLPSMVPGLQTGGLTSQPESPTTPLAAAENQNPPPPPFNDGTRQRPPIRQQVSGSGESDDANGEDVTMGDDSADTEAAEPIVEVQNAMEIDDVDGRDAMLDDGSEARGRGITIPPNASEPSDAETFNITHRSPADGSIVNGAAPAGNGALGFSPARTTVPTVPAPGPGAQQAPYPAYLRDRPVTPAMLAVMPRDEDVLLALQLLAYISKYCNLRSYFQQTHLVPRLKIGKDIQVLDQANGQLVSPTEPDEDQEEYILPDDVNIFPLVEKFTARHNTKDMQYWACVVMRNLCRKDESRGGIRQCAYYKCGKWEEYHRQFAKCRRCRRTKYCSKECQKSAWAFHRHWCHNAP